MSFWQIVFYLRKLIHEGHFWQQQNATETNHVRINRLSFLQMLGVILAVLFVYKTPQGVSETQIDSLLSSLSIITGFFFAVVLLGYDLFCKIQMPEMSSEKEKIKVLKSRNFLKKYNALSCYAILLAMTVIAMLIGTLLFGKQINLAEDFVVAETIHAVDLSVTVKFIFIVVWRFYMIYFLIDFFLVTLFAIGSLFQFLNVQMLEKSIRYQINPNKVKSDYHVYQDNYGKKGVFSLLILIVLLLIGGFVLIFF